MAAMVASSPVLRSAFVGPSFSLRPGENPHCPPHHHHHRRRRLFRKCRSEMVSAVSSGAGAELHDSVVQLQVGLLQSAVDVGLPLPASDGALNWLAFAVPAALWYVAAKPGSLSGLLDFAYAPVHSFSNISFDADEVQVGRQIGEGSFGIVYEGYIGRGMRKGSQKKELHVILKKVRPNSKGAKEMHYAEIYMNRRVQRTARNACADFLGTTKVSASQKNGRLSEGLWLVWKYQGDRTLAHYMKQKNFPENVAEDVLGRKVKGTSKREVTEQNNSIIRRITTQILTNLRDLHKTGLVHRDVKPLNLILAKDSGTFKLVDLGAAVDLRSGYNYVPDETIIDPTYAAPEHHVMPTSTPQLPPDPLCSVVSPLVWLLNTPDRFDLYSAGLILLQMAVKPLRQDISLLQFNSEFKRVGYNLDTWRKRCRFSDEEFALLDADGAAGWELVKSMLQLRHDRASFIWPSLGSSRPSAEAALRHRFLTGSFVKLPSFKISEFPQISLPELPAINFMPNFNFDGFPNFNFPKLRSGGPKLDINWGQVNTTISAALPAAITSALTLAAGWLIFGAVKDSAQKSYAVGQWAVESLATIGPISVVSFVLISLWAESQRGREKQVTSKIDVNLGDPQTLSMGTVGIGDTLQHRTNGVLSTSGVGHVAEGLTVSEGDEAEEQTSHLVGSLATADVEILRGATVTEPSSRRPQTGRLQSGYSTGLAEAVHTMELQLASLESSIAAGRVFSRQQQQQIIQMEKLLSRRPKETPKETVSATKQSAN